MRTLLLADKHLAVPAIEQSWRVRVFELGTEIQARRAIFWIQGGARGKLEEIDEASDTPSSRISAA